MVETLPFTPEIAERTRPIYDRVARVIPAVEWPVHAPYVDAINRLKRERNAVILAHNYQTPEIFHGVADIVGDSLQLAREAQRAQADTILVCGVHFMGETAKILNPSRRVIVPDARAGCSLAESITAADVRALRARHPGVPIVTYVNTSAEVKAESDVCCTSSNAVRVVEALGVPTVIMIPDEFLANYVAANTSVEIIAWKGHCEVHERFRGVDVESLRETEEGVLVIAHPECPPDVIAAADFAGSTAAMIDFVRDRAPQRVVLLTECSMSDNVAAEFPNVAFVRPCNLCPHMRRNTLPKILRALETLQDEVLVDESVRVRAQASLDRMMAIA
ncbi:MAG TPA: quinolinate synthase NadA [Candidatus Sulfotelmatobacter sp.]|nr:quinolinate synthase NadA [Candidatus Sulfotelmatobacter sp.]